MLISKTPFRITLGGGGTDLPGYYSQYGGFILSAAINKYMYIIVNQRYEEGFRISYSKTENVKNVEEITHPIVREALKHLKIKNKIEIISIADMPAQSGLGSSGSFTVGLLNVLHSFKNETLSKKELAEEAFYIESEILKEPCGKQDQYIAAYGSVIALHIDNFGDVEVEENILNDDTISQLDKNLLFFSTGIYRNSGIILGEQNKMAQKNEEILVNSFHELKEIGKLCYTNFKKGNIDFFGSSLDKHWKIKKKTSIYMTNDVINEIYEYALANTAIGGKIMGAGGGGFFMFYCNEQQELLRNKMLEKGLKEIKFKITKNGSEVFDLI